MKLANNEQREYCISGYKRTIIQEFNEELVNSFSDSLIRQIIQVIESKKRLECIKKAAVVVLIFVLFTFPAHMMKAQCPSCVLIQPNIPSGSSSVVDGDIITLGTTKTATSTQTLANLSLSGGDLIVSGNLTLTNFSFTSGRLYVNPGGVLIIYGGASLVMGTGTQIFNCGYITLYRNLVTSSNCSIYNCVPGSYFGIPFAQLVLTGSNTSFVNFGTVQTSYFITQNSLSVGAVCMGQNSCIITNRLYNQRVNCFTCPIGPACLNIINYMNNSQVVTNTSNIIACYPPTITISGVSNLGSATINSNCASCSVALPVELAEFNYKCYDNYVHFKWTTVSETNNDYFLLQNSNDVIKFNDIARIEGAGNSYSVLNYLYDDFSYRADQSYMYYRLKQVDFDGHYTYSDIIAIECNNKNDLSLNVYQNQENMLVVDLKGIDANEKFNLSVLDAQGKLVINNITLISGKQAIPILYYLSDGFYMINVLYHDVSLNKKFIFSSLK